MGWRKIGGPAAPYGPVVVYSAAPNDLLAGSVAKTLLRTIAINANLLGNTGRLRIAVASTNTSNGNDKTLTVALWDGTTEVNIAAPVSTTSGKTTMKSVYLVNRTSQWFNNAGSSAETSTTATPSSATLNLDSGTLDLRIYGTLASAGDTMTLTRAHVEAHYGG